MYKIWSKRLLGFFMLALFAATCLGVPQQAFAGGGEVNTELGDSRLVGYWDLRDRDSFFQVTNTGASSVTIHIQLFNVDDTCQEFNYFDTMTPRDTHVYDVSSLTRNNGLELAAPILDGGHGIIGVTVVDPANGNSFDEENVLTGNQRIIDSTGYEYRTNLAGIENDTSASENDYTANFNGVDGSTFTDLVVISVDTVFSPGGILPVTEQFDIALWDNAENPISCNPVVLGCFPGADDDFEPARAGGGVINVGINQAVVNSRGTQSLCNGTDLEGFVEVEVDGDVGPLSAGNSSNADSYIYFIGLNNNSGTGSMDNAVGE